MKQTKTTMFIVAMFLLACNAGTIMGATYAATDCSSRNLSYPWVQEDVETIGLCRRTTVKQWILTLGQMTFSCSELVKCTGDLFSDGRGNCNKPPKECYHDDNCLEPKMNALKGNCKPADWRLQFSEVCSMFETANGCEETGYMMKVHWVIDSKGVKHVVESLNLIVNQKNLSAYYYNPHLGLDGAITGDKDYCDLRGLNHGCYADHSKPGSQWRVQDMNQMKHVLKMPTCEEEIYCYGSEVIEVFAFKKEPVNTVCEGCHLLCDKNDIVITVPNEQEKFYRVCGRQACMSDFSSEKIHSIARDFYHKIYDEQIQVHVTNGNRDFMFSLKASCPISEICEAITCDFCYIRWVNMKCYSWYHTLLAVLAFYAMFILVSLTIIFLKPVYEFTAAIALIFVKLLRKVFVFFRALLISGSLSIRKIAEDDVEQPMVVRPARVSNLVPSKKVWYTVILILSLILAVESKAPCSNIVVDNIRTETCKKIGSQLACTLSSLLELPLVSYDQASCLHFIDSNYNILGELQVTPVDLSFRCTMRTLYYTRDVKFVGDSITRCPSAGQCVEGWCANVTKSTVVEGLAEIQWPLEQVCKSTPACIFNGCFYCSSSCTVLRYYPRPVSSDIYHVFDCPKWEPSGTFHFLWQGTGQETESTIQLVHGETRDINSEIRATLEFTVQSKTPVLSKSFIASGQKVAIADVSPSGLPAPGTVGQVQCASSQMAATFDKRCAMAPRACSCAPNSECECSQVDLLKAFNPQSTLPLHLGSDYLTTIRQDIALKTSAFGSAKIKIHALGKLVATQKPLDECHIEIDGIDGCHSCLIGAKMSYSCQSVSEQVVILKCGDSVHMQIECSGKQITRSTRLQYNYPLIDLDCSTPCSKNTVRLSGTLKAVGLQSINDGSHIQLYPKESIMDYGSWLSGAWFALGWYNLLWMIGVFVILMMTASVVFGVIKQKLKIN